MRFFAVCLATLSLHCFFSVSLFANDLQSLRLWSDVDGRSIEARVLEINASEQTVRMQRADLFRFEISWDRLAADDRALLKEASEKSDTNDATKTSGSEESPEGEPMPEALPESLELKNVPMVKQKGNFCVPASAAMIAGFHGMKTDQDEVARLSSAMSESNQGTYPGDMLLAMEKLGFRGRIVRWENSEAFQEQILPEIRRALFETGPIYISFRPGIFGPMGHGCVIVGYDDRREELHIYNPWGEEFESDYDRVGTDGYGLVFIDPPKAAPVATADFIEAIKRALPRFEGDFLALHSELTRGGQRNELIWCSRRDARHDKRFARDTARDDGRKILELAFERNPAVLIPHSEDDRTRLVYLVHRPPKGGARFQIYRIDESGWSEPELMTLGRLTRNWVTPLEGEDGKVWELPMIELHPQPGS